MKLTPELIQNSHSDLNPLKERQLNLRGNQIPAIENLGVTKDQHDAIDLTDNSVTTLANFPLMRRLRSLHLANNHIVSISPSLHLSLPNLTTLVLTNNSLAQLGDLEPLKDCRTLQFLNLLSNPVREKKYYRDWVIWRCKTLRVLDFMRIRERERAVAKSLFLTQDDLPTALAASLQSTVTTSAAKAALMAAAVDEPRPSSAVIPGQSGRLMTAEERQKVKTAIANAKTAEEIKKLERSLKEGWIPNA